MNVTKHILYVANGLKKYLISLIFSSLLKSSASPSSAIVSIILTSELKISKTLTRALFDLLLYNTLASIAYYCLVLDNLKFCT